MEVTELHSLGIFTENIYNLQNFSLLVCSDIRGWTRRSLDFQCRNLWFLLTFCENHEGFLLDPDRWFWLQVTEI